MLPACFLLGSEAAFDLTPPGVMNLLGTAGVTGGVEPIGTPQGGGGALDPAELGTHQQQGCPGFPSPVLNPGPSVNEKRK